MQNAAGVFVQPTDASFQSAASSANWKDAKDFYLIITNAPAADAWPIAATNFILMPLAPKKSEGAKEALNFFRWVYKDGDAAASKLGYVPLPDALVAQIEAYWASRLKNSSCARAQPAAIQECGSLLPLIWLMVGGGLRSSQRPQLAARQKNE